VLRVKNTPPQANFPYEERAKNVRGAFLCKLDLSGASVAVLDDVMTTGATLNELARALKRAGATRVENFVICAHRPPLIERARKEYPMDALHPCRES